MKNTLLILLILIAACTSDQKPTYKNYIASWSSDNNQILFYSDRNGNWDVFLINSDGTGLRQVTSSSFNEREPKWHPLNSSYAYSSDSLGVSRVFLRDFDSGAIRMLTDSPGEHSSPSWSPDGNYLAYLAEDNKEWKLLVKNFQDSSIHTLYKGTTWPGRPTWNHSSDATMYSVAIEGKETLHLVKIDGTIVKTYVPGYNSCGNAALSPDGSHIIFDAHSDDVLESGDGRWEIYKMNTSDLSVVRLTHNNKDDWGPRWSRDGKRIVFLGAGLNNTGYELFVMNADGSGLTQLTDKNK